MLMALRPFRGGPMLNPLELDLIEDLKKRTPKARA
jgi:hypothetical protein